MKRSQMIRIICNELGNHDTVRAENILNSIEDAGMLPPEREVVVRDRDDINFTALKYIDYENSWEDE